MLESESSATGRPAYHRARMLKILLFAYSRKVFSGRKIAQMLTENLPMMYLADQQTMSYHTINNFRTSKHANQLIKKCFLYFNHLLQEEGLVDMNPEVRTTSRFISEKGLFLHTLEPGLQKKLNIFIICVYFYFQKIISKPIRSLNLRKI